MKNDQLIRLLPLFLLLLIAVALAFGLFSGPAKLKENRLVGKRIPMFDVETLGDPKKVFTPNAWKGQVAVISAFATWCAPCQEEHSVLMRLAQTGKVAIYGIAWKDKAPNVLAWLTAKGNPYQRIGIDPFGFTTIPLSLTGVPETFVVGPGGTVRFHSTVPLTDEIVKNQILPLVEKLSQK